MHMARCIPTGIHAFVLIFRLIDQIYTLINKFDLAVPRPGTAAKDGRAPLAGRRCLPGTIANQPVAPAN